METPKKKQNKNWLIFTQIGVQMTTTIVLGTYIGYRLDNYYINKNPIYTLVCSLTFIGIALYQVIRQIRNFNE